MDSDVKVIKIAKKAQSTLEYVIILAAAVGVIITVAVALKPKVKDSYDAIHTKIDKIVAE